MTQAFHAYRQLIRHFLPCAGHADGAGRSDGSKQSHCTSSRLNLGAEDTASEGHISRACCVKVLSDADSHPEHSSSVGAGLPLKQEQASVRLPDRLSEQSTADLVESPSAGEDRERAESQMGGSGDAQQASQQRIGGLGSSRPGLKGDRERPALAKVRVKREEGPAGQLLQPGGAVWRQGSSLRKGPSSGRGALAKQASDKRGCTLQRASGSTNFGARLVEMDLFGDLMAAPAPAAAAASAAAVPSPPTRPQAQEASAVPATKSPAEAAAVTAASAALAPAMAAAPAAVQQSTTAAPAPEQREEAESISKAEQPKAELLAKPEPVLKVLGSEPSTPHSPVKGLSIHCRVCLLLLPWVAAWPAKYGSWGCKRSAAYLCGLGSMSMWGKLPA